MLPYLNCAGTNQQLWLKPPLLIQLTNLLKAGHGTRVIRVAVLITLPQTTLDRAMVSKYLLWQKDASVAVDAGLMDDVIWVGAKGL